MGNLADKNLDNNSNAYRFKSSINYIFKLCALLQRMNCFNSSHFCGFQNLGPQNVKSILYQILGVLKEDNVHFVNSKPDKYVLWGFFGGGMDRRGAIISVCCC